MNRISFFWKLSFLKLLYSCSFLILHKYHAKNLFSFIRKGLLKLIFDFHYIFSSILTSFSIKRQLSSDHSIESNSKTPYINHLRMIFLSTSQLWSSIRGWPTESFTKTTIVFLSYKTKINKLGIPIMVKHDILTFNISVEKSLRF